MKRRNKRGQVLALMLILILSPVVAAENRLGPLFDHTGLVALGDVHGSERPVDYLIGQLQQPATAARVDNIVVEFGNARHQALADEYVLSGADLTVESLQPIWRDTLYFMAWQTPQYVRLMSFLRQHNATSEHAIRLVLAEPEFDWNSITREQWQALTVSREISYQRTVQQEVLNRKQTAVLLFGAFHQMKIPLAVAGKEGVFTSLVAGLRNQGEEVITLWPHTGPALESSSPTGGEYQVPTLIDLQTDPYGQQRLSDFSKRFQSDKPLSVIADYYLYQGADLRTAHPDERNIKDRHWHQEMRRRAALIGGRVQQQVDGWLERYVLPCKSHCAKEQ